MTKLESIYLAYEIIDLAKATIEGIFPEIEMSGTLKRLIGLSPKVTEAIFARANLDVLEFLHLVS